MVHPAAARRSPRPDGKDDKVDAATLAHLLCADLPPEAWIAPQQVRDQRARRGPAGLTAVVLTG